MRAQSQKNTIKRKQAYQTGLVAEKWGALYLRLKGYKVIATNYQSKLGQIDLIVSQKDRLAFVEIKHRREQTNDLMALISPTQKKRLIRSAHGFLSQNPQYQNHSLCFDLLFLRPWSWPIHLKNAWGIEI